MKKFLSVLLSVVLIISIWPMGMFGITASAATKYTEGYYTYIVENGKATITDCKTSISGSITIPSTLGGYPVTSIGEDAFEACRGLTSITIPDGVTSIEDYAFYYCRGLTSITIPDSVISIGKGALFWCDSLENITLPFIGSSKTASGTADAVFGYIFGYTTSISNDGPAGSIRPETPMIQYYSSGSGSYFYYYIPSSIKTVTITDATQIPYGAFYNCKYLTSITIPDGVTSIEDYAFYYCSSLTSITIPNSVTGIGDSAFRGCFSLTSITIPDSVTSIGNNVFYNCSSLTSITIPNRVTSISEYAFYGCSKLTSITIPDSVASIGMYAFYNCSSLTSVAIPNGVTSISEYAFYGCSKLTSITIPDSVASIGMYALYNCSSLTSVTIPNGVTSISEYAFYGCSELTSITIPDSVASIGMYALYNCSSLTSVAIPNGVTSISKYAFYGCSKLTSITIPDSVASIGMYAFYNCSSLTSVAIPNGVTSISEYAFYGCSSLNEVYYCGTSNEWDMIEISFYNEKLTDATRSYHKYDDCCDDSCAFCGEIRVPPHIYSNACDITCNVCNQVRKTGPHFVVEYAIPHILTNSSSYPFSLSDGWYTSTNKSNSSQSTFTLTAKHNCSLVIKYKVSSEKNYDKLSIKQNSTTLKIVSGTVSETSLTIDLVEGDALTFTYSKDSSQSSGSDTASFKIDPCTCGTKENAEDMEPTCVGPIVCSVCGITVKPASTVHTYDNACDTDCNVCGITRTIPGHLYDNSCDTTCSECGYIRNVQHYFTNVSCNVCGLKQFPVAIRVTSTSVTLAPYTGYEYSMDGITWQTSNVFAGLEVEMTYTFYQRIAESESNQVNEKSEALLVTTLPKGNCINKAEKPILVNASNNSISLLKVDGYEYKIDDGSWQTSPVFNNLRWRESYTLYQRIKETATHKASDTSEGLVVNLDMNPSVAFCQSMLSDYIDIYGTTLSNGNKRVTKLVSSTYIYFEKTPDGIYCSTYSSTSSSNTSVKYYFGFTLTSNSKYIDPTLLVEGYYGKNLISTLTIEALVDRTTYTNSSNIHLDDYQDGSNGHQLFNTNLKLLCTSMHVFLHDEVGCGIGGVGFLDFSGENDRGFYCDAALNHQLGNKVLKYGYNASCERSGYTGDYCCSYCGEIIEKGRAIQSLGGHKYNNTCDTECNDCGFKRDIEHTYSNNCDTNCDICYAEREVNHLYDNECDSKCNECDFERKAPHIFDHNDDLICNECGYERPPYIIGDVDGNDQVTDADAVYLLYHTFLSDIYPVNQDCDFNGDGEVNDKDAVYLLYYTFLPDLYPIN